MSINNLIGYYSDNLNANICNNSNLKVDQYLSNAFSPENALSELNFLKLNSNLIITLNISDNEQIEYLTKLSKLKVLICKFCPRLTQASLNSLTQLEYLNISFNQHITNFSNLTNLKVLICKFCPNLSEVTFNQLTNLGCEIITK